MFPHDRIQGLRLQTLGLTYFGLISLTAEPSSPSFSELQFFSHDSHEQVAWVPEDLHAV